MSVYHEILATDAYANGITNSPDQGGTYHKGAIFVLSVDATSLDAFTAVAKLQVKPDPNGSTYADYTATPTLFTVTEANAGDVTSFVVAPSASADLDAFMPRYWRVELEVTGEAANLNEVQTIDLGDIAAADTFTLDFDNETTAGITYAANMTAAISSALVNLNGLIVNDFTVVKGTGQVYEVTFGGSRAYQDVPAISITNAVGFTPGGVTEDVKGTGIPTLTLAAQMLN